MSMKPDSITMLTRKQSRIWRALRKMDAINLRESQTQPFPELEGEDREWVWKAQQRINNFSFAYFNDCHYYEEIMLQQCDYDIVFTEAFIKAIPFLLLLPGVEREVLETEEGHNENSFSFIGNDGSQVIKFTLKK
jgi:hypothetical protein